MRKIELLAIPVVMTMAAPAMAQQSHTATFKIDTISYEVTLPDGFCLPEGKTADAAALLASADKQNDTELMIVPCGKAFETDYYAIKTPSGMTGVQIQRAELLAQLKPMFAEPGHDDIFKDATSVASNAVSDAVGKRVDMSGTIKPLGIDAACAYMGGILTVSTDQVSGKGIVSGCVTAIGGRALAVYSAGHGDKPEDVVRHLNMARALADQIRVKPAR